MGQASQMMFVAISVHQVAQHASFVGHLTLGTIVSGNVKSLQKNAVTVGHIYSRGFKYCQRAWVKQVVSESSTADRWWELLQEQKVMPCRALAREVARDDHWIDVFTDGSCMFPSEPAYRFASWAVCVAGLDISWEHSDVIGAGPLPGILQSAFRAEMYAILQAVRWAVKFKRKLRVWCDCLGWWTEFRVFSMVLGRHPSCSQCRSLEQHWRGDWAVGGKKPVHYKSCSSSIGRACDDKFPELGLSAQSFGGQGSKVGQHLPT